MQDSGFGIGRRVKGANTRLCMDLGVRPPSGAQKVRWIEQIYRRYERINAICVQWLPMPEESDAEAANAIAKDGMLNFEGVKEVPDENFTRSFRSSAQV
eukprot:SAG31_NODE_2004_length_6685_cov_2.189341_1_plen_99_part_00